MTTGDAPITQSGISPLVSLVSRDAQLSQVGHLCFGLLPLLPDVHRNLRRIHSSQNVSVRFICHTKIANPTTDRHFHFLHDSADIASTVLLCKKFQRFLCPGKRLSVFTTWLLLLPGAKPKKPHRFARWGFSVLPRKNKVCNYQADRQHNDFSGYGWQG